MITVLTPTYNRAHTLLRLYDSLCIQQANYFEWLVIDDGSNDQTEIFIRKCIAKKKIVIRYFKQVNSGKHVAVNTGVKLAFGDWILIVDSDDALTCDAIKVLSEKITLHNNPELVGICFRKAFFNNKIIVVIPFEKEYVFLHPSVAGNVFKGDLAYAFKKQILSNNPFPKFKNEKFVPELYIWNKIGDLGKIIFYTKKIIYFCEYLSDGYSANFNVNIKKNPYGFLIFYKSQINREKNILRKLKTVIRVIQCYAYIIIKRSSL